MIMNKIYQPIVIEMANDIITDLTESEFFTDYEIQSTVFAEKYLLDKLTEKFILGELENEDDEFLGVFNDDEFEVVLREIVAGSVLYELKEKGLVDSYEDDTTEEMFFLTKKGKRVMKKKDGLI
jgi:predicted transcriptional regulator